MERGCFRAIRHNLLNLRELPTGYTPKLATLPRFGHDPAMSLPRLILLCLLSLAIPLQGFAGVQYVDASCPMMQQAMQHEDLSGQDMADMMDAMGCHTNHDDLGKTGKPCPAGNSCQSVGPALLCAFPVLPSLTVAQAAPSSVVPRFQSFDPPVLWRPPAQI